MAAGTGIRQGGSLSRDPAFAASELHDAIAQPDPGLTVFFRSTPYDLDALACEIGRRFGHAHVFGCANAGEIGPAGYLANAIAGFSLPAADCCAASELIPEISALRMQQGHAAAQAAVTALARPDARSEDQLRHAAQRRDVHRRGGAARLDPRAAGIISPARRLGRRRSAVAAHLRLSRGALPPRRGAADAGRHAPPFRIASCHRFRGSGTRMVVTRAAPATRTVSEINAEPAADEYARIAGLPAPAGTRGWAWVSLSWSASRACSRPTSRRGHASGAGRASPSPFSTQSIAPSACISTSSAVKLALWPPRTMKQPGWAAFVAFARSIISGMFAR